ncbi:hypothetical protein LXL04_030336 [Taraxacum kok-saghyz]
MTTGDVELEAGESIGHTVQFLLDYKEKGRDVGNRRPPSIFRVPPVCRDLSPRSFTPTVVSIGPLHRQDKSLQGFEVQKTTYLHRLLDRSGSNPEIMLQECVQKVRGKIKLIRECYAELVIYTDVELTKMMVIDGCFILYFTHVLSHDDEPSLETKLTSAQIIYDLVLIENQIPFFVLEHIFETIILKFSPNASLRGSLLATYVCAAQMARRHRALAAVCFLEARTTAPSATAYLLHRRPVRCFPSPPATAPSATTYRLRRPATSFDFSLSQLRFQPLPASIPLRFSLFNSSFFRFHFESALLPSDFTSNLLSYLRFHFEHSVIQDMVRRLQMFWLRKNKRHLIDHVEILLACYNIFTDDIAKRKVSLDTTHDHIFGLLHNTLKPVHDTKTECDKLPKRHSAVELDRAGVSFMRNKDANWALAMKVELLPRFSWLPWFWRKPTLKMPRLHIDDSSGWIIRNLVMYEQATLVPYYVTTYMWAVGMLIDTPADVAKLAKSGVLSTFSSDENAFNIIYNICKEVVYDNFIYHQEWQQLDTYYNSYWPNVIAVLKRTYFSSPWNIIAFFAGITLFVLTVIQTVFTIMAAYP